MLSLAQLAIGLAGTLCTALSVAFDPPEMNGWFWLSLLLCAAGGVLPLRLPGLGPLPASLPVIGALALVADASEAMSAGLCAGFFTLLAGESDPPGAPARWLSAWTSGGAIALAAGMAAAGISRMGLTMQLPFGAKPPAAEDLTRSFLLLSATLLAAAVMAILPLGVELRRQRNRVRVAERRARTGLALVESIALAIEARDRTSETHLRRMRIYAVEVGRRIGMPDEEIEALEYAALLHDIGKLVVPESILSKPAGLSAEEFDMMSTHARVGAEILETTSLSSSVASMVRHHHERYDGSGYPDGLIGMEIPLGSRILAAVDTFDALTSERPYRKGLPLQEAVSFLRQHAGTLFDPRIVKILVDHHVELEQRLHHEGSGEGSIAPPGRMAGAGSAPAAARAPAASRQPVLDRIASSHMEVYSLHEISQALGKTLNLEESLGLIAGKLQRLIHSTSCAIFVADAGTGALRARHATGPAAARIMGLTLAPGESLSGWAALERRSACGGGVSPDGRSTSRSDLEAFADDPVLGRLTCSLVAPMLVDDTVVGVLALYDRQGRDYSAQEERLLSLIAKQVAPGVRAGLLFEQTQEYALTDSLTGLPNSRYMFMAFEQEAARARAEGSPLTLLLMDIDNFREINDDFGHHAGDRFLVGVAKAIRAQMRLCDTCIRYSGDEFVALLPRLGPEELAAVVERLTEAARDYCLEDRPGRPARLALSIGHATMPADGDDFESLMSAAARRMRQDRSRRRAGASSPADSLPDPALSDDRSH